MEELQSTAEKLQQELALRGKYYFKGFGNLLQSILGNLENFITTKRTPERERNIRDALNKVIDLYKSIPFKQITNHPDYGLLLEMNKTISQLVTKVERALSGERGVDESEQAIEVLAVKGNEYRARLKSLLEQLRQQPGHEKDCFKTTDINGKVWESANI